MTGEGQVSCEVDSEAVGHTTQHDLIIYVQVLHYSYCTYLALIYFTVWKGISIIFLNILVKAVLLEISIFDYCMTITYYKETFRLMNFCYQFSFTIRPTSFSKALCFLNLFFQRLEYVVFIKLTS